MEPQKETNLIDNMIKDLERGWDAIAADFDKDMTTLDEKQKLDFSPIDKKLTTFKTWLDKLQLDSNQDSN